MLSPIIDHPRRRQQLHNKVPHCRHPRRQQLLDMMLYTFDLRLLQQTRKKQSSPELRQYTQMPNLFGQHLVLN